MLIAFYLKSQPEKMARKFWDVINRGSCANQMPKEIFFPEIRPGRTPVEAVPVSRIGSHCLQECSRVHGPQPDSDRHTAGGRSTDHRTVPEVAALATFEKVSEAVKFGVGQGLVLGESSHWESPTCALGRYGLRQ